MTSITSSEPFIDAMDLLDICRMCGGQNTDIAPFIVKFMTAEGLFNEKARLRHSGNSPKPYTPRNDPSGWTPRLHEKEWWQLRGAILRRDGHICTYCKDEDGPFEVDHIVPVTRGGSNEPANLCVACKPCNSSKGDRLLSEWRGRYR